MSKNPWKLAGQKTQEENDNLAHHTESEVETEHRPHQKIAIAMSVVGLILFVIGIAPFVSNINLFKASTAQDPLSALLLGAQDIDSNEIDPVNTPTTSPTSTATSSPSSTPSSTPTPSNNVTEENGNTTATSNNENTTGQAKIENNTATAETGSLRASGETNNTQSNTGISSSQNDPDLDALLGSTPKKTTPVVIVPSSIPAEKNAHTGTVDNGGMLHNAAGDETNSTDTTNDTTDTTNVENAPINAETGPADMWIVLFLCIFGAVIIRNGKHIFSSHANY